MKSTTTDQHYRFIRVVSRRCRQLSEVVDRLQVFPVRPETYSVTNDNIQELFESWRVQLELLERCFDKNMTNPEPEELIQSFHFSGTPANEKNIRFIRVSSVRINQLFTILTSLSHAAFPPYISKKSERDALITILRQQYENTRDLFSPKALMNDFMGNLEAPTYKVLSLNVNAKAGTAGLGASLTEDVLPALDPLEAADILAFNELFKSKEEFPSFIHTLKEANYRIISDPRPASDHANECLLALGPRVISLREKLPVFYPDTPSGTDYIATVLPLYSGVRLGIASIRLHPALSDNEYQSHLNQGDLSSASYKNMAKDALPALNKMISRLKNEGNADVLVLMGDHNHARILTSGNYSGLDQEPASEAVQRELLLNQNLILKTPQGGSFLYNKKTGIEIPDDHLTVSPTISVKSLTYSWLDSPKLDHAALCAQLVFPTSTSPHVN